MRKSKKVQKKNCFKVIHLCNSAENGEKYRLIKKVAKETVSETHAKTYEGFYKELRTKIGDLQNCKE